MHVPCLQTRRWRSVTSARAAVRTRRRLHHGSARDRLQRSRFYATLITHGVLFCPDNPRLVCQVLASQLHTNIPSWHKRLCIALFFQRAGAFHFLRHRLQSDEVVIVDEGLFHRSVNLFAWRSEPPDRKTIMAYLRTLPFPISSCSSERAGCRMLGTG